MRMKKDYAIVPENYAGEEEPNAWMVEIMHPDFRGVLIKYEDIQIDGPRVKHAVRIKFQPKILREGFEEWVYDCESIAFKNMTTEILKDILLSCDARL